MLISAEIRWFWPEVAPDVLEHWFRQELKAYPPGKSAGCEAGGGRQRTDQYLTEPGQGELGIKARGNQPGLEIKGLLGTSKVEFAYKTYPIQLWAKWTSQVLRPSDGAIAEVLKTRWLRKYEWQEGNLTELALGPDESLLDKERKLPELGCNLELTQLELRLTGRLSGWWTLGCEAFGPLDKAEVILARVLGHLGTTRLPDLSKGLLLSYPEWLARVGG